MIIIITIISVVNNRETADDFLQEELSRLEAYFEKRNIKNNSISQADVAWHLDHSLKTVNRITEQLQQSDPKAFHPKFSIQRLIVHTTGRIPRGVAQSPQSVRPPELITLDSLKTQLEQARQNLSIIAQLDENAFFDHPVFHHLDRDQTRRFLVIHTKHHLKIITDILEE